MNSSIFKLRCWEAGLMVLMVFGCSAHDGESTADASSQSSQSSTDSTSSDSEKTEKRHSNRLARESSPYLLQHAHNPVDWYPWGPDAFEKAKKENKPIFLSIGYSSCFWCHVMERKVFENEKIAEYMNEHFVNVKVDREERPDVDDIYMTSLHVYLQAVGSRQGGGWPLSMFLTPQGKPFAGGTYFPPEDEMGRTGFSTVLAKVHELWTNNREDIEKTADLLTREVQRAMKPRLAPATVKIEKSLVDDVTGSLLKSYDPVHGGVDFRPSAPDSPKFPVPSKLALLQYAIDSQKDKESEKVLVHTLNSIADGGIHDHLGGGFHRYSTDRRWLVPHFEKMLYDQSQLADVYVEAYRQTGDEKYRKAAEGIFTFLFREMTDPRGGFYSALDAETDGVEGEYYVWSQEEVTEALGEENAKLFRKAYGLEEPKVFEHGYVLHLPGSLEETAGELKMPAGELERRLSGMRTRLLELRQKREPLRKDDKVLTSWNGLMIRALANAGRVLENKEYLEAAEKAARFILKEMRDDKGRLHRTYRDKRARLNAYLDDYAFLIDGLLALHQATGNEEWLETARKLTDQQIDLFWDEKGHAFFFTPHHHEELIARTKNAYDSVLPSGNSISVRNLIRLTERTGEEKYRKYAEQTLQVFAGSLSQFPGGMTNMALAIAEFLDTSGSEQPRKTQSSPEQDSGGTPEAARKSRSGLESVIFQVAAESARSDKDEQKKEELVEAQAFLSVDKLPAGSNCKIVVKLTIKKGWHINANPPRPKFLKPTELAIESREGVKLSDVRYPKSKPFTVQGIEETLRVYEGEVPIFGTLQIPADVKSGQDELKLQIRYQACNDAQCLTPRTLKLEGKIPIAASGEDVRQINADLFKEKKKDQ